MILHVKLYALYSLENERGGGDMKLSWDLNKF